MSEIAYRDIRGRWSLGIFWSSFVRERSRFIAFNVALLLSVGLRVVVALGALSQEGSEGTQAMIWIVTVMCVVFMVGIALAVVRSSLSDARDVSGAEAKASLETVVSMLKSGALSERTLINVGRGWESAAEVPEVEDVMAELQRRRARSRGVAAIVVVLVVVGASLLALR